MNFKERSDAFRRIDALIRRKGTGTPKQLSERLNTSEKTTYRYLEQLRMNYDAPLHYCKQRQTYYYDNEDFKLLL
jgi:predicted DNA-binding transcriptional regulator YafY